MLEFIPWIQDCFTERLRIEGGVFLPPQEPGAGTTLTAEAMERFGK